MKRKIYLKTFPNLMIYLLLLFAFVPPVIYLAWIRKTEKIEIERWGPLLFTFFWGATISIVIALFLEVFLSISLKDFFENYNFLALFLGVVVAPIVEEFAKPTALSLSFIRKNINGLEDGLIYGAAAGLGFSATENLLYGIKFADQGWIVLIALFYTRTIGCCLLHASATALTGYGYSIDLIEKKGFNAILPYFGLAILAHSIYNLFAFSSQFTYQVFGVVIAITFAVSMMIWVRKKIRMLDRYEGKSAI